MANRLTSPILYVSVTVTDRHASGLADCELTGSAVLLARQWPSKGRTAPDFWQLQALVGLVRTQSVRSRRVWKLICLASKKIAEAPKAVHNHPVRANRIDLQQFEVVREHYELAPAQVASVLDGILEFTGRASTDLGVSQPTDSVPERGYRA